MKRALVLLAEGVEEMEAVIAIDVLRRCGVETVSAATGPTLEVTASRGVRLLADVLLNDSHSLEFQALVIPGGAGGSRRLAGDPRVLQLVKLFAKRGRLLAAICAGPTVLRAAGVLDGRRMTCHPGVHEAFPGVTIAGERVVVDGNIVTSQGPGTTMEFALAVGRLLVGEEPAAKAAEGLLLPAGTRW
jgi:4-methyl-5(b-hydroxyethyl)-thiazole monophosphate biosynthesis